MSFDYEGKETNCLQVAADNIDSIEAIQPGPSSEILGTDNSPTHDTARDMERMAPEEWSRGGIRRDEGLCQGLSPDISCGSLRQHLLLADMTCWYFSNMHAIFNLVKDNPTSKIFFISTPKFPFEHSKCTIYTLTKFLRNYGKVERLLAIETKNKQSFSTQHKVQTVEFHWN